MRRSLFLFWGILLSTSIVKGQTPNVVLPYSYDLYQKIDKEAYTIKSRSHTALKPFFADDSLLRPRVDSIFSFGVDSSRKTWAGRKLFNEHLVDVKTNEYTAYVDFLPDFLIGRDVSGGRNTWLNTRGFQAGGTVGKKFSFYTSGYENQGRFAKYYENYALTAHVVPGQSHDRGIGKDLRDWSYISGYVSYTPVKYLNITFGQDKTFIGDGYRSLLLSDFSSNYPFLKLTGNLGRVQYMAMWASMQENPAAPKISYYAGNRKKGAVFHYLDWNVNNRLSLGFFDAVVWSRTDDEGNYRGFDPGYANPIIFLRPVESENGSPDNTALGFTAKYEVLEKTAVYGQFFLDEFVAESLTKISGSNRNKWAWQLGVRGTDLLKIPRLNYLLEYNLARPYTYTGRIWTISYTHFNEPLAHPFGANFKELVGKLNYSYGRFDFSTQFNLANYGLDLNQFTHFGQNIFKPYPLQETQNNTVGQGIPTDLSYGEFRASYLLNPNYNLRFELGGVFRKETNSFVTDKTSWITFGLRSSFRNLYRDLSSISRFRPQFNGQ